MNYGILKRVEADLHDTIRHFEICKLDTEHYAVPIMKAKNQLPTSKDKLPYTKKIVNSTRSQETIFAKRGQVSQLMLDFTNRTTRLKIKKIIDSRRLFRQTVRVKGMATPERKSDGYYQIDDLVMENCEFESTFRNFIDDPYNKKHLIQLFTNKSKIMEMNVQMDGCNYGQPTETKIRKLSLELQEMNLH